MIKDDGLKMKGRLQISLNDKVDKKKKIEKFLKFKIDKKLMSYAKKNCTFLNCLQR